MQKEVFELCCLASSKNLPVTGPLLRDLLPPNMTLQEFAALNDGCEIAYDAFVFLYFVSEAEPEKKHC